MKIGTEKLTKENPLTLEEQQKLLDDLLMIEALVVGYENYCKSIGKFNEAKVFVRKFMENVTSLDMDTALGHKDGEA